MRPVSVEDESKEEGASTDLPKNFLRALTFREFNSYLVTHGSGTNVEAEVSVPSPLILLIVCSPLSLSNACYRIYLNV